MYIVKCRWVNAVLLALLALWNCVACDRDCVSFYLKCRTVMFEYETVINMSPSELK